MKTVVDNTKCSRRAFNNSCLMYKILIGIIFITASSNVFVTAISPSNVIERPVVITGLGKIEGSVMRSRLGALFYAFRGIRYAAPPIGDLRFKVSTYLISV